MRILGYDINLPEYKYFKPTSLTWWSGAILVASGLLRIWGIEVPVLSDTLRPILDVFYKNSDPGTMISVGLGIIGLRAAPGVSSTKSF